MGQPVRAYIKLAALTGLPLLAYFALRRTSYDVDVHAPHGHFYIVSLVSVLALAFAAAVGIVAIRIRNIKVSFLSLAYVSLAAMFILHGLSTPGFLMSHNAISGSLAQLSMLLAAVWLWLSSLSADRRFIRWLSARHVWLLPVWCMLLLVSGTALWLFPEAVSHFHLKGNIGKWVVTAVIGLLTGWTIYRNLQAYRASRFRLQLEIAYSTGWMMAAQMIIVTGEPWTASWWLYHFLLLAAVIVVVSGIVREHLSGSVTASAKRLFRANPKDWILAYITPGVKRLVMETEAKNSYTAGHNYRVAQYALKLGEELGLSNDQLKAIAQGGLVHDIGKLHIPDGILNKPGKLTDEERAVIESHPAAGFDMCKRLGFMQEELAIIRYHHEKWDGTGYPDKLSGEGIPLVARIAAVADVYDALTSSRAYRQAMSHEEAMSILTAESGRHFDPRCIGAWERIAAEQKEQLAEIRNSSMTSIHHTTITEDDER